MAPDSHLLIVDDDERIRGLLQKFLLRNGFWVTAARDAEHARRVLSGLEFDMIILDVMMPGEDGISLTKSLRAGGVSTPVLLLTAKGDTGDRIEGLEAGADDYLAKPFEPKELLLRINAILRRMPAAAADEAPKVLTLGPIRYDIERGEMWRGSDLVRLTATEAQLMRIFSSCPGEALSRSKLVEDLGRDRGQAQERAVDVQITRLRRKIEEDPKQPRYLQTVRGAGYMLAPD
ncbi:MAG: response regulator [Pseudomonadota bacterium]